MSEDEAQKGPLTLEQAAFTLALAIEGEIEREQSLTFLQAEGLVTEDVINFVENKASLTNGEVYMLIKDVLVANGIVYE